LQCDGEREWQCRLAKTCGSAAFQVMSWIEVVRLASASPGGLEVVGPSATP
jgi:hypothetical protein